MKDTIKILLLIITFSAASHTIDFTKPFIVVYREDGTILSTHTAFEYAEKSILEAGEGVYRVERPSFNVVVEGHGDPIPPPEPDPIPDPPTEPDPPPLPSGSCDAIINAGDNIQSSFGLINDGETLCLNDGTYLQAVNVPSNKHIAAVNIGQAVIDGSQLPDANWNYGTLTLEGNNSSATGLKVQFAPLHWDACKIKGTNNRFNAMSCSHGGAYKHKIPLMVGGTGHIIENSWFYGEGRYVIQCYNGNNITFKSNVVRWDKTIAGEPNEPNAAMSNYSCSDMLWKGNISLDYGKPETRMKHCGDFCMSTNTNEPNLRVQYLANIVVNHAIDTDNNYGLRADQKGTLPSSDITVNDFYVVGSKSIMYFNSLYQNVQINNCTDKNSVGESGGHGSIICTNDAVISTSYQHQDLIKADMCASGERQSDWCKTSLNLSDYIESF